MRFPKKCHECPLCLGDICWPKVVGALLLLSAPLPYYLSDSLTGMDKCSWCVGCIDIQSARQYEGTKFVDKGV